MALVVASHCQTHIRPSLAIRYVQLLAPHCQTRNSVHWDIPSAWRKEDVTMCLIWAVLLVRKIKIHHTWDAPNQPVFRLLCGEHSRGKKKKCIFAYLDDHAAIIGGVSAKLSDSNRSWQYCRSSKIINELHSRSPKRSSSSLFPWSRKSEDFKFWILFYLFWKKGVVKG